MAWKCYFVRCHRDIILEDLIEMRHTRWQEVYIKRTEEGALTLEYASHHPLVKLWDLNWRMARWRGDVTKRRFNRSLHAKISSAVWMFCSEKVGRRCCETQTDLHFHFLVVELRLLLAHHQSGAMTQPTIRLSFLKNLLGLNVKHSQLYLVPAASRDSETAGRLPHPAS